MTFRRLIAAASATALTIFCYAQQNCHMSPGTRWTIDDDGAIVWQLPSAQDSKDMAQVGGIPHFDHIEMSGEQISTVIRWGVNEKGAFVCDRSLVFPMLRTIPNDTHASLTRHISTDIASLLSINGMCLREEKVQKVRLNGEIEVESEWCYGYRGAAEYLCQGTLKMKRTIFPSRTLPMLCEQYKLTNCTDKALSVEVPDFEQTLKTDPQKGVTGGYCIRTEISGAGTYTLPAGESLEFCAIFQGFREQETALSPDPAHEHAARMEYIRSDIDSCLVLETPDKILDTEFRFAKIRASESIYRTAGGLMHGPGGEAYYAAIWANDQAEYVNPFFPFLGYAAGNESASNSFTHFARFMNDEFNPLPCSIIAEGSDIWNGAGDRGDAAMIACGASRFALSLGDRDEAQRLWPLISWCLEYCNRRLNDKGVVLSDTDELERRFPAGEANLSTSCLYYDALVSSAYLASELGLPRKEAKLYRARAEKLSKAIEEYFGAEIDGYNTYRYYDGCTVLRSWICLPLIMGLAGKPAGQHQGSSAGRLEGTVSALLGPELMTDDGLLTAQGSSTFWDRSTLYALRGIYIAGQEDKATDFLHNYSQRRLLGDHVPYPIEAWPEGNQRHLSAESGLYCRIVTEGMFGIRPVGLRSFELTPRLPSGWPFMRLRHILAFGSDFDLSVERMSNGRLLVKISGTGAGTGTGTRASIGLERTYVIREGQTLRIKL